jgi:hypothetical protein
MRALRAISLQANARVMMDVCWKNCAALFVLVAAGWAVGVLPVAVRLF